MPTDNDIYFIPPSVPCVSCGQPIRTYTLLQTETCPVCAASQPKSHYGKYFAVIKDVAAPADPEKDASR